MLVTGIGVATIAFLGALPRSARASRVARTPTRAEASQALVPPTFTARADDAGRDGGTGLVRLTVVNHGNQDAENVVVRLGLFNSADEYVSETFTPLFRLNGHGGVATATSGYPLAGVAGYRLLAVTANIASSPRTLAEAQPPPAVLAAILPDSCDLQSASAPVLPQLPASPTGN